MYLTNRIIRAVAMIASLFLFISIVNAADVQRYSHEGSTFIKNVRVIDGLGNRAKQEQDILITGGRISAIGKTGSLTRPDGALEIDGTGLTALPGLIDAHIHLQGGWGNGTLPGDEFAIKLDDASLQQTLNAYIYSGVTTLLDIGNDHDWVLGIRDRIEKEEFLSPRFFVAGAPWSQAPNGWDAAGAEEDRGDVDMASRVVDNLETIGVQMDIYQADGIEIIKLYSGISAFVAQLVVMEAHERGIKTVADLWSLNLDTMWMQSTGLDGWAHTGGFDIAPKANHKWMAENDRFVIGNAVLGEQLSGLRVADEAGQRLMASEPLIVDIWGQQAIDIFYESHPQIRELLYDGADSFYQMMGFGNLQRFRENFLVNIRNGHKAGVLIACGSDDLYPGLWPGEAIHREMELLVMGGISPVDAIQICSSNGAKVLRREQEFGSLQPGLVADLLIVEGNPAKNISDTRNVRHVFMGGKQVNRESLKLVN
ncbi:MAG: amidohydrolase family protein [Gammaproteobacteria bacterium]